jgi:hypothetical protein
MTELRVSSNNKNMEQTFIIFGSNAAEVCDLLLAARNLEAGKPGEREQVNEERLFNARRLEKNGSSSRFGPLSRKQDYTLVFVLAFFVGRVQFSRVVNRCLVIVSTAYIQFGSWLSSWRQVFIVVVLYQMLGGV